jgi:hypothetical protein
LGVSICEHVFRESSRGLLLFCGVFEFLIEALTNALAEGIDTARSTGSLRHSLVRNAASGRSLVSYSVEILFRIVGFGSRRSALARSTLSTLRASYIGTTSARNFIGSHFTSASAELVNLVVINDILLSEYRVVAHSSLNVSLAS